MRVGLCLPLTIPYTRWTTNLLLLWPLVMKLLAFLVVATHRKHKEYACTTEHFHIPLILQMQHWHEKMLQLQLKMCAAAHHQCFLVSYMHWTVPATGTCEQGHLCLQEVRYLCEAVKHDRYAGYATTWWRKATLPAVLTKSCLAIICRKYMVLLWLPVLVSKMLGLGGVKKVNKREQNSRRKKIKKGWATGPT